MRNFLLIVCLSGITVASCTVAVEKRSALPPSVTVTCQTIKTTTVVDSSQFVGSLQAKEQATVFAKNEGSIAQILVNPGENVTAGTSIFLLDTGSKIKVPISGTINEISVNRGEFITKGQALTEIINNQTLDLKINVPPERSSKLKTGLPVEIIDSLGKFSIKSSINFISPKVEVNQNGQYILAKATIRNDGSLRNNQYVQARVIWEQKPGVLIPATSVARIGGQSYIFVVEQQKGESGETILVAKQKAIKLGNIQGKQYSVFSGLKAGEKVVVSGLLNLSDGSYIECSR
jgi:multidrug efflux pump subunit AcrA (membrane-fusion protein)